LGFVIKKNPEVKLYLLGFDIGSSSIKGSIINAHTGTLAASASFPDVEMPILALRQGWAEQAPQTWYDNAVKVTRLLKKQAGKKLKDIAAIGISYQMHGLVLVDINKHVLRNSIIWCDSRAVGIGERAADRIGRKKCLKHLLNYPGNFTASKLRWVIENEPAIYKKTYKFMLPGEYVAMRMSDKIVTTVPGLAEEMLWDYANKSVSGDVLRVTGIQRQKIPDIMPTFSIQGELTKKAAQELGLKPGIKISYRAGDQPNNALSLNVLEPGEVAATAGTSGVIFGITDKNLHDTGCRVNTFAHVSNTEKNVRNGVMVCVNGTGILNSWLKHNTTDGRSYQFMNRKASIIPPGSGGVMVLPYGNGAERTLCNREIGASIHNLNFNIHKRRHVFRAGQEGIVFALNYGFEVMKEMGMKTKKVRAGHANMFKSPVFREIFANTCGVAVELYNTDGSQGAARGAGLGAGIFKTRSEAFRGLKRIAVIEPGRRLMSVYGEIYKRWKSILTKELK
jgi:xylulokinase